MRYLIVLLLLSMFGCGPGPKAARGDEPAPLTEKEFAKLQADLGGKKETYTAAVQRFEATVGGLSGKVDALTETVGNATSEINGVKEELRSVRSSIDELADLLTPDVPAADVPQAAPEPFKAPPLIEAGVTLNGKPLDVDATIRQHWRRSWTFPGSIESHLTEHGVAGFESLDSATRKKLHSALHEMGNAPAKAVVKERAVVRAPVSVSNCPGGVCPMPQYQPQRRGLFGRVR